MSIKKDVNALVPETTLADAQRWWSVMRQPVTFTGVPGYPWQPAVLWNAGLVFFPMPSYFYGNHIRFKGHLGYLRELEGHETDALQVAFSFGSSYHFPDRLSNTTREISQELLGGRMPVVISHLEHDGLQWTCTVFSRLAEGETAAFGDETLLTEVNWSVYNPGEDQRAARMACHINAPHVTLGYKCQQDEHVIPYLRTLNLAGPLLLDDCGRARLAVATDGLEVTFHSASPVDAVLTTSGDAENECGIHSDVLAIAGVVPAGKSKSVRLVIPYFPIEIEKMGLALDVSFATALTAAKAYWEREFASAGCIETPETIVNDSFDAYLYHAMLATGRKPRSGHWILKTSPNHYEELWGAHASIAAFSMDLRGKHEWSRRIFETFLANQGPVGKAMTELFGADRVGQSEGYTDHPGFLGNVKDHMAVLWAFYHGWTMWAIGQHTRLSGDWKWLEGHVGELILACDWITEQRNRTKRLDDQGQPVLAYGLLPAGNAFDWGFGHVFWSDAHTYRGLREIADCLVHIGHPRSVEILAEAEAYQQDIVSAVSRCRDAATAVPMEDGSTLPYVPSSVEMLDYFTPDWTYVIAGALNLAWCGIVPPGHELIDQTLAFLEAGKPLGKWLEAEQKYQGWDWGVKAHADEDFVEKTRPDKGRAYFWRHKMTYEPGWVPQAFTFMYRDDLPAYFEHFYSLISNGGQHVNLRTPVESRDGVPWTQPGDANLMWLIRNMLVREECDTLLLAGTCPRAWYGAGQRIAVRDMLTNFGRVSYRVESQGGVISGTFCGDLHTKPQQIKLRLRHPDGALPVTVEIDGCLTLQTGSQWIELPDDCRTFVVRY